MRAIPVLRMLTLEPEELERRAARLAALCPGSLTPTLQRGESAVGGGSFPGAALPTTLVSLHAGDLGPDGLALRLRVGDPAVVARVAGDRVLLDPRTLSEASFPAVGAALAGAVRE
jgi:L-seryl-tRNA(Ser) seleniumtransferase